MKKVTNFLASFARYLFSGGHVQNTNNPGDKEESVKILKNSEFINILRHSADEYAFDNVDRFIVEINKIIPVDQLKKKVLKTELLSVIQEKKGVSHDWYLVFLPWGETPYIGQDIYNVLKNNFSASDYGRLSNQLSNNLTAAYYAYDYLAKLYTVEKGNGVRGFIDKPEYIDMIYQYFGI